MPLSDSIIYLLLHFVLTFRALVFAVVYVVAGVILKKFYKKKEGLDVIPNKVFWVSLPGYVKVMQSIKVCKVCWGLRGSDAMHRATTL